MTDYQLSVLAGVGQHLMQTPDELLEFVLKVLRMFVREVEREQRRRELKRKVGDARDGPSVE